MVAVVYFMLVGNASWLYMLTRLGACQYLLTLVLGQKVPLVKDKRMKHMPGDYSNSSFLQRTLGTQGCLQMCSQDPGGLAF